MNRAQFQASFIQTNQLNESGIIGMDILNQYQAHNNFNNNMLTLIIDKDSYQIPFYEYKPKENQGHLQNIVINDFLQVDEDEVKENNKIELSPNEDNVFKKLMIKYDAIFRKEPGRIKI